MIKGRHFASEQSQGARDYQEDDAGFCPIGEGGADGLLMVLADGMGGHRGGAHASSVAVETFIDSFNHESGSIAERLARALEDANDRIGKDSAENPELEGMGCTLVGVSLTNVGIEWISVGDSPMWLVRGGKLQRLNADHSMAPILQKQVELGELTEEEARRHPQRNALRSAVIGDKLQHVDNSKRPMKLRKGDRLLLASDGLETLEVDEIAQIIADTGEVEAEVLAKTLVDTVDARQRKGQDNTTVMIVDPYVGGVAAFGVVDPDAATERVTLRTGPPGSPTAAGAGERAAPATAAKRKSGVGKGLAIAVVVAAAALAGAVIVFPKLVDQLLGRGDGGTSAASTGTSGSVKPSTGPTTAKPGGTTGPGKSGGGTTGPGTGSGGGSGATAPGGTGAEGRKKSEGSKDKPKTPRKPGRERRRKGPGGETTGRKGSTAASPGGGATGGPDGGSTMPQPGGAGAGPDKPVEPPRVSPPNSGGTTASRPGGGEDSGTN